MFHPPLDGPLRMAFSKAAAVSLGPDCWIGEKASILRGSQIGTGSVIGAQTVVKGDIPPYAVAVGAPAKVIKRRDTR